MSSAAKPSPIPDRRVHAECATFEVVRYERAGKWYVEPKGDGKREAVGVVEAAHRAVAAETLGGEVNLGLPGGSMFDRWIPVVQVKGGAALAEDRSAAQGRGPNYKMSPVHVPSAATRWDCLVDDDVIDAPNEDIARIEFMRALAEDPSLIYVRRHREKGYEHDV